MQKIPTVFRRDPNTPKYVLTDQVDPRCAWVLAGEGTPTRKMDGTCVMRDDAGEWWARREVKPGKPVPENFVPVTSDEATGKTMGWLPMAESSFAKFHAEALPVAPLAAGTYELIGPKINGNPEGRSRHLLMPHGVQIIRTPNDDPLSIIAECRLHGWEGVVWWHPDGRKAKLKVRDIR